jgi:antitoxin PrlF
MGKILQAESTLTDRYQTTIPEPIREVLHLHKRDKICYVIADNGEVVITKSDNEDPILGHFLSFLASDMKMNPSHIHAISSTLRNKAQSLTANIDIDLDSELSDKDE